MFEVENNVLLRYTGDADVVEIPLDVNAIGKEAFRGNEVIRSVYVHKFVATVGEDAFADCGRLTIYCEHAKEPDTWRKRFGRWNSSRRPVYWGVGKRSLLNRDGIQYVIQGEEAVVSRYVGTQNEAEILSEVEGNGKKAKVVRVGKAAFEGSEDLFSLTIPSSVAVVEEGAFEDCISLVISADKPPKTPDWKGDWNCGRPIVWNCKSNKVADNNFTYFFGEDGNRYAVTADKATFVRYLGEGAEEFTVPSTVKYGGKNYPVTVVDSYAMYFAPFKKVVFPAGIVEIGFAACKDCRNMEVVEIADSVARIVDYAFSQCISLTTVDLPAELLDLGEAAFERCYNLVSFVMKAKVKQIRARAFSECRKLVEIEIPDTVRTMGGGVFEYCVSVTKAKLSRNVGEIKFSLMSHCRSMKTLILPVFVERIEEYAFFGCRELEQLIIGRTVAVMGEYVFGGCDKLQLCVELPKKPSAWSPQWNSDERPVIWGFKRT